MLTGVIKQAKASPCGPGACFPAKVKTSCYSDGNNSRIVAANVKTNLQDAARVPEVPVLLDPRLRGIMLALQLESVFTGSYRRPLLDRTRNNSAPTCRVAHLHVACVGIHDTVLIGWSKYSIQLTSHCGGRDCLTASLNYILADMQFANLGRLWIMCVVYLIRHRSIQ